jgi:fermentation-respiration switch protein FrsA (DUF1100 family)
MKRELLTLATVVLVLLQTACTTISIEESNFLHPDQKIQVTKLRKIEQTATTEDITINGFDDVTLSGTLIKVDDAQATVIYFGGNQFRVSAAGGKPAQQILPMNVNILMVDHRGYGNSEGTPTIENLKRDALSVYDYVATRTDLKSTPTILHGHSLGSMIAGYVASERPADALVLEGSITNVKQMTSQRMPWFVKPFVEVNFSGELARVDNLKVVESFTAPLLIITGEDDTQTPPALAETLYQHALSKQKQLYIVKGKHHGNALTGDKLQLH